jgi:hypothetical protein
MKNNYLKAISEEDVEKVNEHVSEYLSSNWEGTRPVIEGVMFVLCSAEHSRGFDLPNERVVVRAVPSYRQQPLAAIEARLLEINSNPDLAIEWKLFAAWHVPSVVHADDLIFEALSPYWPPNKPAESVYECSPEDAWMALTEEFTRNKSNWIALEPEPENQGAQASRLNTVRASQLDIDEEFLPDEDLPFAKA